MYGTAKGVYDCFKLPSLIEPKSLGLDTLSEDESHWLFFFLTWGTFQEGEKVRFKLKRIRRITIGNSVILVNVKIFTSLI